jgi:hypothetical protein
MNKEKQANGKNNKKLKENFHLCMFIFANRKHIYVHIKNSYFVDQKVLIIFSLSIRKKNGSNTSRILIKYEIDKHPL